MNADKNINDLTYQVKGAIFEVSRTLGAGFLEKVYESTADGVKGTGIHVGLLVHFKYPKAEIKGFVLGLNE